MSAPEVGLCLSCGEAVREEGRNTIHLDGFYRCPSPHIGDDADGGFAQLGTFRDLEQKIDSEREDAAADAVENYECDCCADNHTEVATDARAEALRDVVKAVERL
ncbi:hypothetical protein SEA_BIGGITYBASS_50 [Gordonia phage BiggityBass]|nr:hypothetical protein SEA_BIGGITYBASS_50 [Gordonia phage BiggityBass]